MLRRIPLMILIVSLALVFLAAAQSEESRLDRTKDATSSVKPDVKARYTAEEQALLAIQEEGRQRVRGIAEQLKLETDPERRQELQREGIAIKKETRLRFLTALADFALQKGDLVTAQQARDQIDNLNNPRRTVGTPIRQTPDKREIQRGGQ